MQLSPNNIHQLGLSSPRTPRTPIHLRSRQARRARHIMKLQQKQKEDAIVNAQIQKHRDYSQYSRKNYSKSKISTINESSTQERSGITQLSSQKSKSVQKGQQNANLSYLKFVMNSVGQSKITSTTAQINSVQGQVQQKQKRQRQSRKTHKRISITLQSVRQKIRSSLKKNIPSIQKRPKKSINKEQSNMKTMFPLIQQYVMTPSKTNIQNDSGIVFKQKRRCFQYDGFCLQISSKVDMGKSMRKGVGQTIQLHLQLLNLLPVYVKQFDQVYQDTQCWQQLMFLVYKKFYLQRIKVLKAITSFQSSNPFILQLCKVQSSSLIDFKGTLQAYRLQTSLAKQNGQISEALRNLYNMIIQKSGNKINLLQEDNFSTQIYGLIQQQVRLLQQSSQCSVVTQKRMHLSIKCCLLIASLDGFEVPLEEIVVSQQYCSSQLEHFNRFTEYINA